MSIGRRDVPEPGLALRLDGEARRVASQHGRLDGLRAAVLDALQALDLAGARRTFEDLETALTAHFDIEERLYFPALASCRRDLGADVDALFAEHGTLRKRVAEVRGHFAAENGFACAVTLDGLVRALEEHERREEALMKEGARDARSP